MLTLGPLSFAIYKLAFCLQKSVFKVSSPRLCFNKIDASLPQHVSLSLKLARNVILLFCHLQELGLYLRDLCFLQSDSFPLAFYCLDLLGVFLLEHTVYLLNLPIQTFLN